jgi:type III protein arginine methyltransferase
MTDWSIDLSTALASGDPAFMKAMLARVPEHVLQGAVPVLKELARISVKDGKLEEALVVYDQLIATASDSVDLHTQRAQVYFRLDRLEEALKDAVRITELQPEQAVGYQLQAEAYDGLRNRPQAIAAYRQALRFAPADAKIKQRIQFLETEHHKAQLLQQTLNPQAAAERLQIELPPPPQVTFNPALFADPALPDTVEKFRADGLRQHLWRYSAQQSPKNVLARLEDSVWLEAWDTALSAMADATVLLRGSELGLFALRALHHGARHVLAVESFPLDARIASGIIHKHFLSAWHARHGAAIQEWTEEQRSESFAACAKDIEIALVSDEQPPGADRDYLAFANIDHSLLGTGIVKAIKQQRARRVLPAKATVFAMAIEWAYPAAPFELQPLNELRWSLHPQALDLAPEAWTALTAPVRVGEIDFANFAETRWDVALPVIAAGNVTAIIFWFELDLGGARLSNAPGSALRCIKPAVQYTDAVSVTLGETLPLRVHVKETRLHFETQPPATQERAHGLPSWYVPMLLDQSRNEAYRAAIQGALASQPAQLVLDIGAGCGLLSMLAATHGAERVAGCEVHPAIARIGGEIARQNALDHQITLIPKDCRQLQIPADLPERADLAVFELFDCSLIGEGILHFLAYAREHLLTPDARYLPAAARIHAMLIEYRLDRIWDIDVNLLNPYLFTSSFSNVDASKLPYRALSEPFELFAFDFATASPTPDAKELRVPVIAPGTVGAVLFWFDLQLDATSCISNAPGSGQTLHWKQGLQFLPEVRVAAGMQLPLLAKHNGSSLTLQWQPDALPKDALSKLPRFDPRWLAATHELEQQTRGLMQHCLQNADEFTKVAELAKRFGIDPAAHDLDPIIAQRFAAAFFGL